MSNRVLNHRGYLGSIEVSIDDNCLHGQLLFIQDLVNYEGESPEALRRAFEEAVDNYLAQCKELGVEPDKTFSGTFNVRVDSELHKKACVWAAQEGVSLNEFVCSAIRAATTNERTVVAETHHHMHNHFHQAEAEGEYGQFETAIWQRAEKVQ